MRKVSSIRVDRWSSPMGSKRTREWLDWARRGKRWSGGFHFHEIWVMHSMWVWYGVCIDHGV